MSNGISRLPAVERFKISYNTIHAEIRNNIIITLFRTQESISICVLCNKVFWHSRCSCESTFSLKEMYMHHMREFHSEWLNAYWANKYRIPQHVKSSHKRYPLKPWKDPESLFCDTKFLKDFLDKDPAHGDECADKEGDN